MTCDHKWYLRNTPHVENGMMVRRYACDECNAQDEIRTPDIFPHIAEWLDRIYKMDFSKDLKRADVVITREMTMAREMILPQFTHPTVEQQDDAYRVMRALEPQSVVDNTMIGRVRLWLRSRGEDVLPGDTIKALLKIAHGTSKDPAYDSVCAYSPVQYGRVQQPELQRSHGRRAYDK